MKSKTIPLLIITIVIGAIIVAVVIFTTTDTTTNTAKNTTTNTTSNTNSAYNTGSGPLISFADCIAYSDSIIMESYPRKCTSSTGETFTEDIGNELDKTDLIRIDAPRPNDSVTSPLTITGQARGTWFFEGEFPVYIYDVQNRLIGQGSAVTPGDWMTEEFIPYQATLEFTEPAYGPGKLYLNKHNASDDADLDDALIIPVDFPL